MEDLVMVGLIWWRSRSQLVTSLIGLSFTSFSYLLSCCPLSSFSQLLLPLKVSISAPRSVFLPFPSFFPPSLLKFDSLSIPEFFFCVILLGYGFTCITILLPYAIIDFWRNLFRDWIRRVIYFFLVKFGPILWLLNYFTRIPIVLRDLIALLL